MFRQSSVRTILLKLVSKKGKLSAKDVVELTEGADSSTRPASWEAHASRNVKRKFARESGRPDVYAAVGKFCDEKKQKQFTDTMYFSLPWEIIETDAKPISEWTHIEADAPLYSTRQAWASGRDIRLSVEEIENTVVWGIWGDTAPFLTRDSLYILTYSAVSGNNKRL